jgi:hypothetical protein
MSSSSSTVGQPPARRRSRRGQWKASKRRRDRSDWQFGVAIQQQIVPRVAVDISYNRRWWGNFFYTDNLAIGPQDFDQVTIAAPLNPNCRTAGIRRPSRNGEPRRRD